MTISLAKIQRSMLLAGFMLCLLAGSVLALSSANYRIDWQAEPQGSGGGYTSSTHFAANVTIGQPIVGNMSSPNYRLGLGYWAGLPLFEVHLPVMQRNP